MKIQDQLLEDMKQAMKARDTVVLSVLRFLRSEIKNAEIDTGELSQEAVYKLIKKQLKQIDEAIGELTKAQRSELVAEEQAKRAVLVKYLPEQMDEVTLTELIKKIRVESGETNPGKLIGLVVQASGGTADGSQVSALVRGELS